MMTPYLTETLDSKQCHGCAAVVPFDDNFCRRCGILQKAGAVTAGNSRHWSEIETTVLTDDRSASQLLSGLLVNTIKQKVAAKTAPLRSNPFGAGVVTAIVAIPMWLLIILLSPLDAYTAARSASSRIYH